MTISVIMGTCEFLQSRYTPLKKKKTLFKQWHHVVVTLLLFFAIRLYLSSSKF